MKQYKDLILNVIDYGVEKGDRTGTGTISYFGTQHRYNLADGFPLLTLKYTPFHLIVSELIWFISGCTNVNVLHVNNNHIWDEWAAETGDLGPIYGEQWTNWNGVNQLEEVVKDIRERPDSRRHIVSAWNVDVLPNERISPQENVLKGKQALPPCHTMFQFYVANEKLSCQLYQRSADIMLGVPFNIASYALLTHMVAHVTGLGVGEFVHTIGDAHIYKNHLEGVQTVLEREPLPLPKLLINQTVKDLFDFNVTDFMLDDYRHHERIKFPIAV